MRASVLMLLAAVLVAAGGCTSARKTNPERSATEQLLVTNAVDEAVGRLDLPFDDGTSVYVDATGIEGAYAAYATAALREVVLREGGKLVEGRENADMVLEARAGALSIDEFETLVGIPSTDLPIPLAGELSTPEVALYKRAERRGIVKIATTAYRAENGEHVDSSGPQYGFSHKREWTVLFFISWQDDDLIPKGVEPSRKSFQLPD